MYNSFKKLFLITISLCFSFMLFAEPASTGLTDSDVKNFANNYTTICEALEPYGYSDPQSFTGKVKDADAVEKILEKNGISGPNRINKLSMIGQCMGVAAAEVELAKDPESAAILKAMGMDPLADMKKNINSKDLKVVTNNYASLEKIMAQSEALDKKAQAKQKTATPKRAAKNSYAGRMSQMVFGDDPDMDEESLALYEQMLMNNPNAKLAEQQMEAVMNQIKPEVDKAEANGKQIKKLLDSLKSSKGDCGFIYKTIDKNHANLYKAAKIDTKKYTNLNIEGKEIAEDDSKNRLDTIKIALNTNKGQATFSYFDSSWDKLSDKQYYEINVDDYYTENTYSFTVTKVELYSFKAESKLVDVSPSSGSEYVITTKEGAIIHALDGVDKDNGYRPFAYIWWKGLDKPVEIQSANLSR